MNGLKKCPFCGGEAKIITDILSFDGCSCLSIIECENCHCQTDEFEITQKAIEKWNSRTLEYRETYKDVFLKKFPNAERKYGDELFACVKDIFGKEHEFFRNCIFSGECDECWNRQAKEWRTNKKAEDRVMEDKINIMQKYARLCDSSSCLTCVLNTNGGNCLKTIKRNPEDSVKIIETWAKEHPENEKV